MLLAICKIDFQLWPWVICLKCLIVNTMILWLIDTFENASNWCINDSMLITFITMELKKTSTTWDQDYIILSLIICVSTLASVAISASDIASMSQELPRCLFLYIIYSLFVPTMRDPTAMHCLCITHCNWWMKAM